jgi:hypothetical protein
MHESYPAICTMYSISSTVKFKAYLSALSVTDFVESSLETIMKDLFYTNFDTLIIRTT